MLRLTSRQSSVAALAVAAALLVAEPASAQKGTRGGRGSKPSAGRVSSRVQVRRVAPPSARSARVTGRSVKVQSFRGRSAARRPSTPSRQIRVNRVPTPRERSARAVRSAFTRKADVARLKAGSRDVRDRDRERMKDLFKRGDRPSRRRVGDDRLRRPRDDYRYRRGSGYGSGYRHGYRGGFHHGYHRGFADGYFYRHYHYYGPRLVFGYHYGGFGFYDGRWHFAIVIGGPVLVDYYVTRYGYSWWDGRPGSLYSWDRAARLYRADYTFDLTGRSCVELWIRTERGKDYVIEADPRYWNARDPGDLYQALWSQLEREGRLEIEDRDGALYVFPAGMIQQIEARPCR
jgi:hypothetical protein